MLYRVQNTASVDVCKRLINFADVAVDSRLYQQHYVMIRLFISTVLRHDTAVYINTTASWNGCLYQQHCVMITAVYINSTTSWYDCLYQQHCVMVGYLYQQHYVMIQLFILTALRHDAAVYINSTTPWYDCLYRQNYVMVRRFISTSLRLETAVYINSTTSW
jgi:hypothetical protein